MDRHFKDVGRLFDEGHEDELLERDIEIGCLYNIVPTAESEATKLAKQKYRRIKSQSLEGFEEGEEIEENE